MRFGTVFCDQDPQCIAAHADQKRTATAVTLSGLAVALLGCALILTHPSTRFTVEQ